MPTATTEEEAVKRGFVLGFLFSQALGFAIAAWVVREFVPDYKGL